MPDSFTGSGSLSRRRCCSSSVDRHRLRMCFQRSCSCSVHLMNCFLSLAIAHRSRRYVVIFGRSNRK